VSSLSKAGFVGRKRFSKRHPQRFSLAHAFLLRRSVDEKLVEQSATRWGDAQVAAANHSEPVRDSI